jgi:hypothetical protein
MRLLFFIVCGSFYALIACDKPSVRIGDGVPKPETPSSSEEDADKRTDSVGKPQNVAPAAYCTPAITVAATSAEAGSARFFESSGLVVEGVRFDFNDDGMGDCVLTTSERAAGNATYYLYLMSVEPRFLGEIGANPLIGHFSCNSAKMVNGMCEVSAGLFMIHGEIQSSTYHFDGTVYQKEGRSRLSNPPPKFQGK